ncbi:glycosyltransferase [Georgenia sp. MJ206]|uniref:glycosyltransferase family protein n=1 Tax=Georgenia wangjunii TaxID=3117730 RepID=UPI002F2657D6
MHDDHGRRIAFYSHDTQGLGHIRRNIELAAALVDAEPGTTVLLMTGAPEAGALPLPPCTDVLTLPTVTKDAGGGYAARVLDMPLAELLDMRGRLIATAVRAFAPDLLVVDKVARGLGGELDRCLAMLAAAGPDRTRVVLGLRDVLDAPAVARREWAAEGTTAAVVAHYDEVWVYGDREVYDPVTEYALPGAVAERVRFTGYLAHGRGHTLTVRPGRASDLPPPEPYVLCMVGGGQDGVELARTFVRADLPAGHQGVLVTGPYMGRHLRAELRAAAAARDDLVVHEFVTNGTELVARAAAVVTMGGYNTVCEVLASGAPALVVPRERPRAEQALRAARLARAGYVDSLRPGDADPASLTTWLAGAGGRRPAPHPVDLDGLSAVPVLARRLLATPTRLELTDVPA